MSRPDVQDRWIQHQRRNHKTTTLWACSLCIDRRICQSEEELWKHALEQHKDKLPPEAEEGERKIFRTRYEAESLQKRSIAKDNSQSRKAAVNDGGTAQPEPPPPHSHTKRPLSSSGTFPQSRALSGLGRLNLQDSEDTIMHELPEDGGDKPRKRAAVGDGISAGSASPFQERESESPPPTRSKAHQTSAHYGFSSDPEVQRPHVTRRQLWNPDNTPPTRTNEDPSNTALLLQAQKSRAQALPLQSRKTFPSPQQVANTRQPGATQGIIPVAIVGNRGATLLQTAQGRDDVYDIKPQPETRPISQEQLVAEVKGIYAGLVMVEAKCIEVDNKQAALAQADGTHSKLNNEQWQALIALHRTLLHEHHDFFLASQHPSASLALRRLASKYAMPARMWRHGIHSFLELLRHRLPASLDHMLAFIYLAYSMMALLYETVPAFEDTWIECLGDLGRYRMAIEDDDIRDREVWTGVARHWYSKASDNAPTTGRLYHHLAILARPNALQQLFYYAKSLCVLVPFSSARESVLTLFEPVLNSDNSQGQYRLPPLDTAFVKAHGLLFTNRGIEKYKDTVQECLSLLDNQIGRVTRKFMEQGSHIAIANCVAMLGFASKENVLMRAISPAQNEDDIQMPGASANELSLLMTSFKNAQYLSNATLEVVLQRIGDPNVLPFVHITLVFMLSMARHPGAMIHLQAEFPWELLSIMLNTLVATCADINRIENAQFPLLDKDEARPFPEDFSLRGLLWADNYFPENWFTNEKIDEEEKYHERASMTAQRKERILWLACQITKSSCGLDYDSVKREFSPQVEPVTSRASTFTSEASATTSGTTRTETWPIESANDDGSDDGSVAATPFGE